MMPLSSHSFKQRVQRLQHGPLRGLLAAGATVAQSVKRRSPVYIHVDRDGDWINRQSEATFVTPLYSTVSYDEVDRNVRYFWFHGYRPAQGDTIVDVGAGVGDDAVVFSRAVGPTGRVIAIEAHPRTFRCLEKTIAANRLGNVTSLNLAVSDAPGEITLTDDVEHLANRVGGGGTLRVEARTLDTILASVGVPSASLVKMNIEGAETAALRGASKALETARHWVISCHDFIADRGGDPALRTHVDVVAQLKASGLTIGLPRQDERPWVRYYVDASRG